MDEPELYARCENSKGSLIETVVLFGEVIGIGSRIEKCVKNMHQMRRISCFQVNAIAGWRGRDSLGRERNLNGNEVKHAAMKDKRSAFQKCKINTETKLNVENK